MIRALLLLWVVACCACRFAPAVAAPAVAAPLPTLNVQITLDSGVIRVGDIWRDAGAKAEAIVGTAPLPGHSFAVDSTQLSFIAHLYDVDWKPTSGVERSFVERPGRTLTHDEIRDALAPALVQAGAPPNGSLELTSLNELLVPPLSLPRIAVQEASYDAGSERFTANLAVSAEGIPAQTMRVAGRMVQRVDAVVTTRRLLAGQIIGSGDVQVMPVAARRVSVALAPGLADVVGQATRRAIAAGQPVATTDVGPPILVEMGAAVVLTLDTPGMSISTQGRALTAGGRGDMIQVMNMSSRAVLEARVSGPGEASILPGSSPVTVAAVNSPLRSPEVAQ
jgi:flagella basal body P-ring formation protein FlgA